MGHDGRYGGACYLLTGEMREAFEDAYDDLWSRVEGILGQEDGVWRAGCDEILPEGMQSLRTAYREGLIRRINEQMRLILQNPQTDFFGFEPEPVFHETLTLIMTEAGRKLDGCRCPEDAVLVIRSNAWNGS